jgi:hypothetical protein
MRPSQLPSIREFMSRDHHEDVDRLNETLHSSGDAGLVSEMPPIPFTGNIDVIEKGNCVCLIGINPLWAASERSHIDEYQPAMELIEKFHVGDELAFQDYINSRLNYFKADYARFGHYDKPTMGYPLLFFPDETTRSVWNNHAFAMDIVPYFSRNAGKLDRRRIIQEANSDPAILSHHAMIEDIIREVKPSVIHLNGSHAIEVFEKLGWTEEPLERLGELGRKYGLRAGFSTIGDMKIKILAHNQFGFGRSLPTKKHWPDIVTAWNEWNS